MYTSDVMVIMKFFGHTLIKNICFPNRSIGISAVWHTHRPGSGRYLLCGWFGAQSAAVGPGWKRDVTLMNSEEKSSWAMCRCVHDENRSKIIVFILVFKAKVAVDVTHWILCGIAVMTATVISCSNCYWRRNILSPHLDQMRLRLHHFLWNHRLGCCPAGAKVHRASILFCFGWQGTLHEIFGRPGSTYYNMRGMLCFAMCYFGV